jgi:branched-chain amino acid transport system ATP-binding protein
MILTVNVVDAYYGEVQVLSNVSFRVAGGEIVTVIGSNGAGKTTLMRALSGLTRIRAGTILFQGVKIECLPPHRIVDMGMIHIPEGRMLFSHMTVLENLEMGAYLKKHEKDRSLERVYRLFPVLAEKRNHQASTLSGGEQQMLSIGRGIMALPKLLILDEPSLGLAPLLVENVFNALRLINEDGLPILLVEQNTSLALAVSKRGYVIENGRIVLEGASCELKDSELVRKAFLGI